MSTTYRILCLSHDPAIILEAEWTDLHPARAAAFEPGAHVEIAHHADCDLLIGAWSTRLEAFGCPRRDEGHQRAHVHPEWITVELARVLAAAYDTALPDPGLTGSLSQLPQCWSSLRLHRLRELLLPAPVAEPVLVGTPA